MKNFEPTRFVSTFKWCPLVSAWVKKFAVPFILLSACCVSAQTSGMNSYIRALAENYNLGSAVSAGQSRIIFYRPVSAPTPGAISVLVNEQYHASLSAGGYTFLCLNPGFAELGVRQMEVEMRPNKDGQDAISSVDLKSGQTYYMRVDEQQGRRIFLRPVAAAQALPELAATRMQVHTVSRVTPVQNCRTIEAPQASYPPQAPAPMSPPAQMYPPAPPYPAMAAPVQSYQLAGDTLFAFNRSDRAGMTQDGVVAIQRLMNQIRMEFARVDRIHVIGHADPLGNDYSNERLSIDRANTVREYMEMSGAMTGRVSTEGRGSREPVVRYCSRVTSFESMACNQPNRRVAVEVAGLRR